MEKKHKIKRENIESYIVFSNSTETKHIATFKDIMGERKFVRIRSNIKMAFHKAKNENKSQQNKYDKYIEHSILNENTLNKRAKNKSLTPEEQIIENEVIKEIISEICNLPEPQNRRVYMYVVDGLKYSEISKIEKVHRSVAKRSIDAGLNKLRKKLKKFLIY